MWWLVLTRLTALKEAERPTTGHIRLAVPFLPFGPVEVCQNPVEGGRLTGPQSTSLTTNRTEESRPSVPELNRIATRSPTPSRSIERQ